MKISEYNLNNNLNNLVWYSADIAALAEAESTIVSHIQTLPALSITYSGTDDYYAIRLDADNSEIWLYSGSSLPSTAFDEPSGVIKISWEGKTPSDLASEITNYQGWVAKSLTSLNKLSSNELFVYVKSGEDWTYTNAWSSYGTTNLSIEKSFDRSIIIRASRYMFLYDRRSVIEVLDPGRVNLYAPWYFRLTPGVFKVVNDNGTHIYSLYEHIIDGNWSRYSGRPYRYVSHSIPLDVSGSRIKVQHTNIQNVEIYINGNQTYDIKAVYYNHGIIELNFPIPEGVTVAVSYEYKDDYYQYRDLNINPLYSDIEDKYIILYLTPRVSHKSTGVEYYTNTVHHALGDSLEDAYDNITGDNPVILTVVKFNTPTGYSFLDLRSPGGGALDVEGLERIQPESAMYWDISWIGGKPYPGHGSILVRVPDDVSVSKDKLDRVISVGEKAIFDYYEESEAPTQEDLWLQQYMTILEKDCPDTLHVWMPKFDGKRTSGTTYDLVSGTALNLGTGATFSGDGKYVVLDDGEVATATLTPRPYIYLGFVYDMVDWENADYALHTYPNHAQVYWNNGAKALGMIPSYDGSSADWTNIAEVKWYDVSGLKFIAHEVVMNANEFIARSPQEGFHVDDTGAALYSASDITIHLEGCTNIAAFIYGGATTSAPLEDLAERVKSGETGRLLSNLFADLIG